ncbi:TPA: hypothetical protein KDY51_005041 [Vibrio parahaemolyticus]|nr:hypothetical protein [Vibrio parahaemolyticus]
MKWQVRYALENINKNPGRSTAEFVEKDVIRVTTIDQPDVLAAISGEYTINKELAEQYVTECPDIDFLCGYRKECVWEGEAISFLKENNIGWGNLGTLCSGALDGNANYAEHKVYAFAARLIHQYGIVDSVVREFDRVFQVTLKGGLKVRIGLIPDYEPTADNVRSLWEKFGPFDIAWNINPNGEPATTARQAGEELGCKVLKTEGMKAFLQSL